MFWNNGKNMVFIQIVIVYATGIPAFVLQNALDAVSLRLGYITNANEKRSGKRLSSSQFKKRTCSQKLGGQGYVWSTAVRNYSVTNFTANRDANH